MNSCIAPAQKPTASSAVTPPSALFLFDTGLHPIQIREKGVDRVLADLAPSIPAALESRDVLVENRRQLRNRAAPAVELPLVIVIRLAAMDEDQLAISQVSEARQVKRPQRHPEF